MMKVKVQNLTGLSVFLGKVILLCNSYLSFLLHYQFQELKQAKVS